MQLTLTFDLDATRETMSGEFMTAHHPSWKDHENPTDLELTNSIGNEIDSWLEDLGIEFDTISSSNQQQTLDALWEFISEKDIPAIMQKLKEKNL